MAVWDCFLFHDELDLLAVRLEELDAVVDRFVLCESPVTFQGNPKPLHFDEHKQRFARWADRIVHVIATGLDGKTTWEREGAQRDRILGGLAEAAPDDLVLLSDVDEIPKPEALSRVHPSGFTAFEQRFFCFAVDWEHPKGWRGTLAARRSEIDSIAKMRQRRDRAPRIQSAGWHLTWLGGPHATLAKLDAFSHTEIKERVRPGLRADSYLHEGRHVDGVKLVPVDVDATWPCAIHERRCPPGWFRPRREGTG
jgi:hypothetical protein